MRIVVLTLELRELREEVRRLSEVVEGIRKDNEC